MYLWLLIFTIWCSTQSLFARGPVGKPCHRNYECESKICFLYRCAINIPGDETDRKGPKPRKHYLEHIQLHTMGDRTSFRKSGSSDPVKYHVDIPDSKPSTESPPLYTDNYIKISKVEPAVAASELLEEPQVYIRTVQAGNQGRTQDRNQGGNTRIETLLKEYKKDREDVEADKFDNEKDELLNQQEKSARSSDRKLKELDQEKNLRDDQLNRIDQRKLSAAVSGGVAAVVNEEENPAEEEELKPRPRKCKQPKVSEEECVEEPVTEDPCKIAPIPKACPPPTEPNPWVPEPLTVKTVNTRPCALEYIFISKSAKEVMSNQQLEEADASFKNETDKIKNECNHDCRQKLAGKKGDSDDDKDGDKGSSDEESDKKTDEDGEKEGGKVKSEEEGKDTETDANDDTEKPKTDDTKTT